MLLRVGADTGAASGGVLGPLFGDGSFEYLPIPDSGGSDERTYGRLIGRKGKPLVEYFPAARRPVMMSTPVHVDPEFDGFTYGDPTRLKTNLASLCSGDLLVFYAGLRSFDHVTPDRLYIIGYFEVALAGFARDLGEIVIREHFGTNEHARDPATLEKQWQRLVLIKGGPGSRLLTKASPISQEGKDRRGSPIHVLASTLVPVFGRFTQLNAIQRCAPRWVDAAHTEEAARYIRGLS